MRLDQQCLMNDRLRCGVTRFPCPGGLWRLRLHRQEHGHSRHVTSLVHAVVGQPVDGSGCSVTSGGSRCPADRFFRPTSTAPKITLATRPMTTRLNSIWMVTRVRARSVLAVMSPNPTVENTVTVKYMALILSMGSVKLSAWACPVK